MTPVNAEKCTIYVAEGFGYHRIECRRAAVSRRPWAQYENAVEVCYVEKGKRKERWLYRGDRPRIVVLAGWGHPEATVAMETVENTRDYTVSRSRHSAYSPEWDKEFDAFFAAYKAAKNPTVLVDTRQISVASDS